jgi:hypothetical protein
MLQRVPLVMWLCPVSIIHNHSGPVIMDFQVLDPGVIP